MGTLLTVTTCDDEWSFGKIFLFFLFKSSQIAFLLSGAESNPEDRVKRFPILNMCLDSLHPGSVLPVRNDHLSTEGVSRDAGMAWSVTAILDGPGGRPLCFAAQGRARTHPFFL